MGVITLDKQEECNLQDKIFCIKVHDIDPEIVQIGLCHN